MAKGIIASWPIRRLQTFTTITLDCGHIVHKARLQCCRGFVKNIKRQGKAFLWDRKTHGSRFIVQDIYSRASFQYEMNKYLLYYFKIITGGHNRNKFHKIWLCTRLLKYKSDQKETYSPQNVKTAFTLAAWSDCNRILWLKTFKAGFMCGLGLDMYLESCEMNQSVQCWHACRYRTMVVFT